MDVDVGVGVGTAIGEWTNDIVSTLPRLELKPDTKKEKEKRVQTSCTPYQVLGTEFCLTIGDSTYGC